MFCCFHQTSSLCENRFYSLSCDDGAALDTPVIGHRSDVYSGFLVKLHCEGTWLMKVWKLKHEAAREKLEKSFPAGAKVLLSLRLTCCPKTG